MNIVGIDLFPRNRPLNEDELAHRLDQKVVADVEPHYQLSVIKMNSCYLDCVDRDFGGRGFALAASLLGFSLFLFAFLFFVYESLAGGGASADIANDPWQDILFFSFLLTLITVFLWWSASSEICRYTHYPIRFDRRNGLVHFFTPQGDLVTAEWGKLFFTFGRYGRQADVRGHVLGDDGKTVLWSFALSYSDVQVARERPNLLMRHWEFIRRYMEDGPQAVTGQVQFCMPVDGCREKFKSGAERVFAEIVGAPFFMLPVLYIFGLIHICARWLVMRSSKIPRWPEEIEKLCAIEPNDPYAITADDEGNRIAVYPEAAAAHGVRFAAQPSIGEGNIGVKAPKRPGDRPEVVRGKSSSKKTGKPR